MSKYVLLYTSSWCSNSQDAKRALIEWGIPTNILNIKDDAKAAARLRSLVGFESVPTAVIAAEGSLDPITPPEALPVGRSPRGFDRGSVITEATRPQLRAWLVRNGLLSE